MAFVSTQKLQQLYESEGAAFTVRHLTEALREGHLKPADFSIRELAEGLIPDGREFVNALNPRQNASMNLLEAGTAVDTAAFSNITGQIVYAKILEAYNDPGFIGDQLCQTVPTQFDGEKIPGVSGLGDQAETIDEGMTYPTAGLSEDWIETPRTTKRGFIVPITKEALFFDRTGLILSRAGQVGQALGIGKEKRIIDLALGQSNNHKWKGTEYNTYYASGDSGPWTNKIVDVLTDWTDINAAELLFEAMTDPYTSEPIVMGTNRVMVVPGALRVSALRIVNATEVRYDPNAALGTAKDVAIGANPIGQAMNPYSVLSSPYVYSRTSSATNWFYGDPTQAFAYMENWGIQTQQASENSEADFTQDIVVRFKASERGVAAVLNPRYMIQSTGGG